MDVVERARASYAARAWSDAYECFRRAGNINVQGADEGAEWVRATYGIDYDRLRAVKRTYDPDNLFRSNRNVLPA